MMFVPLAHILHLVLLLLLISVEFQDEHCSLATEAVADMPAELSYDVYADDARGPLFEELWYLAA